MKKLDLEVFDIMVPDVITDVVESVVSQMTGKCAEPIDICKELGLYPQLIKFLYETTGCNYEIISDGIMIRRGKSYQGSWHTDEDVYDGVTSTKTAIVWIDGEVGQAGLLFLDDSGSIHEVSFKPNTLLVFDSLVFHKNTPYNSDKFRKVLFLSLIEPS